jgi:pimeloyl-ACP methyl ester carboxylesterase
MTGTSLRLTVKISLLLAITSASGCMFSALDEDLEKLGHATHLFAGSTKTPEGDSVEIVVVAMHDAAGKDIAGFRMMSGEGPFEIRSTREPTWLFAFYDVNHDLIFQSDETYTWANDGNAIDPAIQTTDDIDLVFTDDAGRHAARPKHLVDEPLEDKFGNYVKLSVGTVTPLHSPLFSAEQAEKGLWEPFKFTEDGGAGLHFLEPYDPDRIPVLFVHGINGTPRNFERLVGSLDKSRYQAWVVSYPSGMRLSWVARGIYQVMQVLHVQLKFEELHIVAHSMGGLVSKGTLNICRTNRSCDYIHSYTTISTPWNGVASAENGTKWSPTVVPVWWDLAPSGQYITTLFDTPLPEDLVYHLIFGFRSSGGFSGESSDGVIRLSSQLRVEAQQAAHTIMGIDAGHVDILYDDAAIKKIAAILDSSN